MRVLIALAGLSLIPGLAPAHDPYYAGYGVGYGHVYGYPYAYIPRLESDIAQIRDEIRKQRLQSQTRDRKHGAQVSSLLSQIDLQHQVSATQACYYRTVGGLELCADLFDEKSDELARCEKLVAERNPGC